MPHFPFFPPTFLMTTGTSLFLSRKKIMTLASKLLHMIVTRPYTFFPTLYNCREGNEKAASIKISSGIPEMLSNGYKFFATKSTCHNPLRKIKPALNSSFLVNTTGHLDSCPVVFWVILNRGVSVWICCSMTAFNKQRQSENFTFALWPTLQSLRKCSF